MARVARTLVPTWVLFAGWAHTSAQAQPRLPDLTELTIEQLMSIEITSVSKKAEHLWESAAAVSVITGEDIRRAGVKSIPEALRLVPGLQVAQLNSHRWAISARGFNQAFATKLLVLIDGRSVYTPLFAGVFWDVQDTLLEDIDRIEVIRGPGGTLWGANAVNGVINIITKHAKATQGGYLEAGGGSEERGFVGTRYGGRVGDDLFYRGYFKYVNRDNLVTATGREAADDWRTYRGGFRLDWAPSTRDTVTVQGDLYKGDFGETLTFPSLSSRSFSVTSDNRGDFAGGNLLTRWRHRAADRRETTVQFYYDRTHRDEFLNRETRDTVDLEFQHRFPIGMRHDLIWGLGARVTIDDIDNSASTVFTPTHRTDHLVSGFIQDQIILIRDRLMLTLGSKFEHNSYSGFEVQPNARLLYSPNDWNRVWAAISRAVRTPSRAERDIQIDLAARLGPGGLPTLFQVVGNSDFTSEELLAFELGYRVQPVEWLSVDLAGFYTIYDNLRTNELGTPALMMSASPPHIVQPLLMDNRMSGNTYGVEIASTWHPVGFWRLHLNYSYLKVEIHSDPTSILIDLGRFSPRHQVQVRSLLDLPWHLQFDASAFFVDRLPELVPSVPSYLRLDLRLGWRPTQAFDLSVVGQNLLDNRHPEFRPVGVDPVHDTEVQRSVYVQATWRF